MTSLKIITTIQQQILLGEFNLQVDERISDCESNAVAIVDKSAKFSCPK